MIVRCICGKNLRVADQHVGKRIRCPSCGESFITRTTSSAVTASAAALPRRRIAVPDRVNDETPATPRKLAAGARRSSPVLLIASGGLGVLALLGFVASGVLFVLGVHASPVNRPVIARPEAKAAPKDAKAAPNK